MAKRTAKKRGEPKSAKSSSVLDSYSFQAGNIPISIRISQKPGEYVPIYEVNISHISPTTEGILERIRQELIKQVNLGMVDITDEKKGTIIEDRFKETITVLVRKYFPDVDTETEGFLITYLIAKALGLGSLELLMQDANLEEIVVNTTDEPVWVYHKRFEWLKTNITLSNEEETRHYAATIGRKIGRQITILQPLLDAHLTSGDRVNATLHPISTKGNTITIRKFSKDPWTITRFIESGTISPRAVALIWLAIQYEMSILIAGGTASGKTSTLNCLASFFPPNQRIITIEDTREIMLPVFLHWVPMVTRLPNPEGKGELTMGNLLVNSLRMRPDRILVGEVRRKAESETLFEAIHTGHSVYATIHANSAQETVDRLTTPPIDVPPILIPAISLIVVQLRNRRTGARRTFQIAEVLPDASINVLMQYDPRKDVLVEKSKSKAFLETLRLFTGYSATDVEKDLQEKIKVLEYLVKQKISSVNDVGHIVAMYYTDKKQLFSCIKNNTCIRRS
ncbi:hypothetical protein AUJ68_03180 [Candidatus Woesearchaeota archaeon CG1_02_57_44]|nr:MAG: hypothetical protein AUJ68_03180 [Candidatus Woesearchaeota archaeon CG1_02_57_44]